MNSQPLDRAQAEFNRRSFLRAATAAALPLALLQRSGWTAETPRAGGGFVIREKEPVNLEMPFTALDNSITPNDRFYVRCHFPIPKIEAKTWSLKVEGQVENALTISLEDLRKMPAQTTPALLECAGNGRVFLAPKVKGAQWELGAVGNAEWTGVRLADVLAKAGVKPGSVEVVLEGADEGEIEEPPRPAGKIHYARSLPIEKARGEVLLAYAMNGEPLSAAHGAPVRAIVPGWYGMASVKWLTRVIVVNEPFRGFFQTVQYTIWDRREGLPVEVPLGELPVKSEISRPEIGEVVPAGEKVRVHGAAWTSDSQITKVEVSDDGGTTWQAAKLLGEPVKNSWQLWEYTWQTPAQRGRQTLMSRATDARGREQPAKRDPNRNSYMINHCLPIEVEVR